ncbi:MAG: GNAT family N-acetyltransferase [Ktedonobacterales bacterium]|nr:GNAT family N-acetyltransferase [Ktedonobacterales bacterium]
MELRPITRDNWRDCIRLKVRPEQEDFVANNTYSLAQAAYTPGLVPLAAYVGDEMVGFTMYDTQPDEQGRYWIHRVMIDPNKQGLGYGRTLMELVIARLRHDIPTLREIALDYHENNAVAAKLYANLGFRETGERNDHEIVASLRIA